MANSSNKAKEDLDANNRDITMELNSAVENLNPEEVSDEEEHDDSELEEDIAAELEMGWGPPQEGAPREDAGGDEPIQVDIHSDTSLDSENLDEENSDSDNLPTQWNFDCYIIGDGFGVEPAVRKLYTDKYPSLRVGKALSREES